MDERVEEEKRQRKGCLFGQRKYEGGIKGQIYGCMHEGRKKKGWILNPDVVSGDLCGT